MTTTLNPLADAAKERATRTFFTGLGIDVVIAVAVFIAANVNGISDRSGIILASVALGKTVVQSAASYILRYFSVPKTEIPASPAPVWETPVTEEESGPDLDYAAEGPGND